MEYVIVSGSREQVEKEVSYNLRHGFFLEGELIVISYKEATHERTVLVFTQAMLKKESNDENT